MNKRFLLLALIFSVSLTAATICVAFPKPAIVQELEDWTVDVRFDQPRQITVDLVGKGPQRFWYTIVTLTNNTGSDVPFYPECDLVTDTFSVVVSGKAIDNAVFEAIKLQQQGSYPFLESLDFVDHRILQGQDNSKDIAIIWQDFDPNAKNISLFISGLSNEAVEIDHPVKVDAAGNPEKVRLRKTLELDYAIAGDARLRATAKLAFTKRTWVMR